MSRDVSWMRSDALRDSIASNLVQRADEERTAKEWRPTVDLVLDLAMARQSLVSKDEQ